MLRNFVASTSRMWDASSGLWGVAWIVLVGGAIYVGCFVLWSSRRS